MNVNTDKRHLLLPGNSRATATIDNGYTESGDEQILLGTSIDSNLTFENHISNICKKTSQKLNALPRITPYMTIHHRNLQVLATEMFNIYRGLSPEILR